MRSERVGIPDSRVLGSLATLRTAMGLAETDREEDDPRFRDRREDTASEEDREREGATKVLLSALDAVACTEAMATGGAGDQVQSCVSASAPSFIQQQGPAKAGGRKKFPPL